MHINEKKLQKDDKYTLTECNFNDVDELKTAGIPGVGFGCGCGSWYLGVYCG